MADYEVSGAYIDAILRPLKRSNAQFAAFKAKLTPETAQLVENSWSSPWHPGAQYEAIQEAAASVLGLEAFSALSHEAVKERFAPIVMPLLQKGLAASNKSPAAILGKLDGLITVAMKGLSLSWKLDEGGRSGTFIVNYPRPVPPSVESAWRGVLQYAFEISQETGKVERATTRGGAVEFVVSW